MEFLLRVGNLTDLVSVVDAVPEGFCVNSQGWVRVGLGTDPSFSRSAGKWGSGGRELQLRRNILRPYL